MGEKERGEVLACYEKYRKCAEKIQQMYLLYRDTKSEEVFNELILLIEQQNLALVRRKLHFYGIYSVENMEEVIQEVRLHIWNLLKQEGEVRYNFPGYVYKMYIYQCYKLTNKQYKDESNLISMDIPIGDDDEKGQVTTLGDTIEDSEIDIELIAVEEEYKEVAASVFRDYCNLIVNAPEYPPRLLALLYVRIVPHHLQDIRDSKRGSAKWAFEHMEEKTVQKLSDETEIYLVKNVDEILVWGPMFRGQLEENVNTVSGTMPLKEIVYTSCYNKDKIEGMAEEMHKNIAKKIVKMITRDQKRMEDIRSYNLEFLIK